MAAPPGPPATPPGPPGPKPPVTLPSPIFGEGIIKRERFRRFRMSGDERQEIVERVLHFVKEDTEARAEDRDRRLQRYAKYRGWTEGKSYPWENSSDFALPDITEACLNLQDTLSNAILGSRPVVSANATRKENAEKERAIDRLLDHQFFVEQPGEQIVEELAELFLIDGVMTAFVPWIREFRPVTDIRIYDPIPIEANPVEYFHQVLEKEFPGAKYYRTDEEGWDYRVEETEKNPEATASFYTNRQTLDVELLIKHEVSTYDGPRILVKDYDDILVAARVANLQPPSPKNPGGAPHVVMVDNPTVSEIDGLQRTGFYDLITDEQMLDLGLRTRNTSDEEAKEQKDTIQGTQDYTPKEISHRTLTVYTCFDVFDLDGDGKDEDVIWWVLAEQKVLLKVMALTEMYPADPPRRPFAETPFLPVKGRREGISLPELMEGTHDFMKEVLDQGMDGGTLATTPFFFYRASSSLKPEILRPWPGDGIPLSDPQRDVNFPTIPFDGSFSLNTYFTIRQMSERLTLIGDLQAGRVPQGKSSALRTASGIDTILAQGEARPERILRRFFMGFQEIFKQMHELNQHFLPDTKRIRVLGMMEPGENPYPEIVRKEDLDGRFVFDFRASVLNASKAANQQGLEQLITMLINPIMIQMGLVTPDKIYLLIRDFAQMTGQDPDRYIQPPTPTAGRQRITAEEAVAVIFDHLAPDGLPAEEPKAHYQKLFAMMQDDDEIIGRFDHSQMQILSSWMMQVAQLAQQMEQEKEMAGLAQNFQQKIAAGDQSGGGNGANPPVGGEGTQTNQNELIDETLPGAGGGSGGGVQ